MHHDHLGGVPGGDGEAGGAAFERGDALLEHRVGRVADARIDVAESPEREQIGGVLHILEDIGRGLVDRGGTRIRGGVWCRSGVNLCGFKTPLACVVAHECSCSQKVLRARLGKPEHQAKWLA